MRRRNERISKRTALEYHNKVISKLFKNDPYYGCYALAVVIFVMGLIRDFLYMRLRNCVV